MPCLYMLHNHDCLPLKVELSWKLIMPLSYVCMVSFSEHSDI